MSRHRKIFSLSHSMAWIAISVFFVLPGVANAVEASSNPTDPPDQAAKAPPVGPDIEFESKTIDFGRVREGKKVEIIYRFTNTGDQPLEIPYVHPGCGCTTKGDWDKRVEPGQTGKIPVALNTARMNGKVQKSVSVRTNVPQKKNHTLKMKGTVWIPVAVNPRNVNFGRAKDENAVLTRDLRIVNNMEAPIKILSVENRTAAFHGEIKETSPGREYTLTVKTVPPLKMGTNSDVLLLKTDHPEIREVKISASCYVTPSVHVSPRQLVIPAGPLTNGIERAIFVQHSTAAPLTLSEIAVNHDQVGTRVDESVPGRNFKIVVTFPKGFVVPKEEPLNLTFKTDDPAFPTVEVPFRAMYFPTPVPKAKNPGSGSKGK